MLKTDREYERVESPHWPMSATGPSVPREPQTLSMAHPIADVSKVGREETVSSKSRDSFDQSTIAGFSTSSHHCRKLVGVVFSGVRGSAVSRPLFLAAAMSAMPCAMASDIPNSMNLD
jgi:hypothetical protein